MYVEILNFNYLYIKEKKPNSPWKQPGVVFPAELDDSVRPAAKKHLLELACCMDHEGRVVGKRDLCERMRRCERAVEPWHVDDSPCHAGKRYERPWRLVALPPALLVLVHFLHGMYRVEELLGE